MFVSLQMQRFLEMHIAIAAREKMLAEYYVATYNTVHPMNFRISTTTVHGVQETTHTEYKRTGFARWSRMQQE